VPLRSVTIQAMHSSVKSIPPISVEKGPLIRLSAGSVQFATRSQVHAAPQQSPSLVQTTSAQGAIGRHSPMPSHTVPGPQVPAPHATAAPSRVQGASLSWHSPEITSHTWSGPQGSGSWP
jgi:hypothetical protein